MQISAIDHIVLCVADIEATFGFYEKVLGMERREDRSGKWSLHFGTAKISDQDAGSTPDIAKKTVPGSGNFCLLTKTLRRRGFWGGGGLKIHHTLVAQRW